jgi:hypothetical protein
VIGIRLCVQRDLTQKKCESLAYGRVLRDVPALVSAAEAHFGSWGKALYAAGIDPNLYFVHHKWRKT